MEQVRERSYQRALLLSDHRKDKECGKKIAWFLFLTILKCFLNCFTLRTQVTSCAFLTAVHTLSVQCSGTSSDTFNPTHNRNFWNDELCLHLLFIADPDPENPDPTSECLSPDPLLRTCKSPLKLSKVMYATPSILVRVCIT